MDDPQSRRGYEHEVQIYSLDTYELYDSLVEGMESRIGRVGLRAMTCCK